MGPKVGGATLYNGCPILREGWGSNCRGRGVGLAKLKQGRQGRAKVKDSRAQCLKRHAEKLRRIIFTLLCVKKNVRK